MASAVDIIEEQIRALSKPGKEALLRVLLEELDGPPDPEVQATWLEEVQRRDDELSSGNVTGVRAEEVFSVPAPAPTTSPPQTNPQTTHRETGSTRPAAIPHTRRRAADNAAADGSGSRSPTEEIGWYRAQEISWSPSQEIDWVRSEEMLQVTTSRGDFTKVLLREATPQTLIQSGAMTVNGDSALMAAMFGALDDVDPQFSVVTP